MRGASLSISARASTSGTRDRRETGVPVEEGRNRPVVLLRQDRARDVDDPPAGFDQRPRAIEHDGLFVAADIEAAGTQAPLGVRVAAPGADAGAGRVDHHAIDLAIEVRHRIGAGARRPDLHVAHTRTRDALVDRREAAGIGIGGVKLAVVVHHRRQRQRLAAASGAKVDDLLVRLDA